MKLKFLLLFLIAVSMGAPTKIFAQVNTIGAIRVAQDAQILRDGSLTIARIGAALAVKDTLQTGPNGSIGLVLNDNSVISIGPSTKFTLAEFEFTPREGKLGFIGELAKGTLEYISGKIAKLAKDAIRFRTPYTTVGVRGTRLLIRVAE